MQLNITSQNVPTRYYRDNVDDANCEFWLFVLPQPIFHGICHLAVCAFEMAWEMKTLTELCDIFISKLAIYWHCGRRDEKKVKLRKYLGFVLCCVCRFENWRTRRPLPRIYYYFYVGTCCYVYVVGICVAFFGFPSEICTPSTHLSCNLHICFVLRRKWIILIVVLCVTETN